LSKAIRRDFDRDAALWRCPIRKARDQLPLRRKALLQRQVRFK